MDGLKRLEIGLRWLRKANPDAFEMTSWTSQQPDGITSRVMLKKLRAGTCGTSACAAGWMGLCPALIAEGLHLVGNGGSGMVPTYDERSSWYGLEKFFELKDDEVRFLFDESRYGDPSLDAVCARIETFILNKRKLAKAAAAS